MPDTFDFKTFRPAFKKAAAIIQYNRLEPNPRAEDFDRSLRAEVRDPLWMLCRQWQTGEFQGEDAGSPVQATILGQHRKPRRVALGRASEALPFPEEVPLETFVEAESFRPDLYTLVQMSRHWMKLLREAGVESAYKNHQARFPAPAFAIDPQIDPEAHQLLALAAGEIFDAYALLQMLEKDAGDYAAWLVSESAIDSAAKKTLLEKVAPQFRQWFQRLYYQPAASAGNAWQASQLEYRFAMDSRASGTIREELLAEQYAEGRLDWYSFDRNATIGDVPPEENLQYFIPAPLTFRGMPNPRFWQMEDRAIDLGKIETGPTGVLGMLMTEYGLTYSNDWFLLPYDLKTNTLCEIKGIVVKDVFGQYFMVKAAAKLNDPFGWFHLDMNAPSAPIRMLYLPPSVGKILESEPVETVQFLRDEMANMVWAVERTVPSQAGGGLDPQQTPPPATAAANPAAAPVRYVLGTMVPDNWIPFIPVAAGTGAIRLQRARLPQDIGTRARGVLLSEVKGPYFIEEEEVPRAGAIVQRSWQRARWLNGKTYLWVGRRKTAGRGEGSSGLVFDQLLNNS